MKDKKMIELLSYVKLSTYRVKVLLALNKQEKFVLASELSKIIDIRITHIGATLKELTDKKLAFCPNPDVKRGKLYEITDNGRDIADYLEK